MIYKTSWFLKHFLTGLINLKQLVISRYTNKMYRMTDGSNKIIKDRVFYS